MVNKITSRFIVSVIVGILTADIFSTASNINTTEADDHIRDDIVYATKKMEAIMQKSYDNAKDDVAAECKKDGYDYELTMESFENQGSPFADYDYKGFISAYATIQQYCKANGVDMNNGINSINFVNVSYTPAEITEYVPEQIDFYVKNKDGTYSKDGTDYISEPCDIPVYKETTTGTYKPNGTAHISLDKTITKYAQVELTPISIDDVYKTFHLKRDDLAEDESVRLNKINDLLGQADLGQSTFLSESSVATEDDVKIVDNALACADSDLAKSMINVGAQIIGRVPYEWGGKSSITGFDDTWYTFDDTGRQKGLDCSGYIQWILRTVGVDGWEQIGSTSAVLSSDKLHAVSQNELKPGDFGLFYADDSDKINHIGMYLGNGYWIHCSSAANTVTISSNMKFTIFRRLNSLPDGTDSSSGIDQETAPDNADMNLIQPDTPNQSIDDSEAMLMAKIVQCESYCEGYNGWVCVAQVIRDRILSDSFPDTVSGVVSAHNQFSTYRKASAMSDDDVDPDLLAVCKSVLAGNLRYFDNDSVIAFNSLHLSDDTWNGWQKYAVVGNHTFYVR